jgi:hypothetical protein
VAVDTTSTPGHSIRYTCAENLDSFVRSLWDANNNFVSFVQLGLVVNNTGETIFQFDPNIQFYNPYVLNAINPRRMIIGTENVYESTDQGDHLTNLGFEAQLINGIAYGGTSGGVANPDVLYVGTIGTGSSPTPRVFVRTTAGGQLAPSNYTGEDVDSIVLDPSDWHSAYVLDASSQVWHTGDAGASWTDITGNLPKITGPLGLYGAGTTGSITFANSTGLPEILVGGANGQIYRMYVTDPENWTALGYNLPNAYVGDLRYNAAADVLVVGTLGRGAFAIPQFSQWVGPLEISDSGQFRLRLVRDATNPALLDIFINNNTAMPTAQVLFADITQIQISGSADNNALTLDFSEGTVDPSFGLSLDAGSTSLTINGGSFGTVTYGYSNATSGTVQLDTNSITYSNVTQVTTTSATNHVIFNLPSGTVGATLRDDGTPGNNMSQLASTNATFVTTTFTEPTNLLTLNSGGGGTATIATAANFSGDFHSGLTIAGVQATDIVTLNTLTLNTGSGNLAVTGNTITINGSISVSGSVQLTAGGSILEGSGGSLTAPSANLSAGTGIGTAANPIGTTLNTLNATAGNGGIFIQQSGGALVLNSVTATGSNSDVAITSNAGITIAAVTAARNVTLNASGDLNLPAVQAGGTLPAVQAGGTLSLTAGSGGVGHALSVLGKLTGSSISIQGGAAGGTTFNINPDSSSSTSMTINGGAGGSDTFKLTPNANVAFTVHAQGVGEALFVSLAGTTNPQLNLANPNAPNLAGQWTFGNRQSITFDTITTLVPPVLATLKRLTPSNAVIQIGSVGSVTFQAAFSEAVSGVAAGNFSLTGTAGISNSNIGTPATTDGGVHWSIQVTGLANATGTLELNLANNTNIVDQLNNPLFTTSFDGQSYTFTQTVAPALTSINRFTPGSQLTNASGVTFQATFTEAVISVTASNFTLTGTAGVSNSSIGTPSTSDGGVHWSISVTVGGANGTLELDLANNTGIVDQLGSPLTTTTLAGQSYTLDHVLPTIAIGAPSTSFTTGTPVTYTVTYGDADFLSSTLNNFNVHLNATGTAAGALTFDPSTGPVRTVTITAISGVGTLGISIDKGSAVDQAGNLAPAAGPSATFLAVSSNLPNPKLVSISRFAPSGAFTNRSSVTFDVGFSKPVKGVMAGNFSLSGTAAGSIGTPTSANGGMDWMVPVTGLGSANGTLELDLANNSGIFDLANDPLATTAFTGQSYTIDHVPPTMSAITRLVPTAALTGASSVTFQATFSEAVMGVAAGNFNLTGTAAVPNANIGTPSTSDGGLDWSITVGSLSSFNGTLELDLANNSGITDLAGNPLTTTSFAGQSYTLDHVPPTVTITSAAPNPPTTGSITVTVTTSKPATDLTASSLVVGNGVVSNFLGSGTSFTFTLAPLVGGTPTTVDIPASSFHDAAGNGNLAATQFSRIFPLAIVVQSFQINPFESTGQRSMVTTLQVTFNTLVTFDSGSFTLTRDDNTPLNATLQAVDTTPVGGTKTVVTITFTGSSIIGKSLADGRYTLTTNAAHIHAGAVTMSADRVDHFFRLFGDLTGDGKVDNADQTLFFAVLASNPSAAAYRFACDYNGDGVVDFSTDYAQFTLRMGKTI